MWRIKKVLVKGLGSDIPGRYLVDRFVLVPALKVPLVSLQPSTTYITGTPSLRFEKWVSQKWVILREWYRRYLLEALKRGTLTLGHAL